MRINVIEKMNFGKMYYWPNCHNSKLFCSLAKTETLNNKKLDIIRELGFDIHVQIEDTKENLFLPKNLPLASGMAVSSELT